MSNMFVFNPNGKKRWDCLVTIKETFCNVEAETKEEFLHVVKETFKEECNIDLEDYEISNIRSNE